MLWAAAGGDVHALTGLLELTDATRAQAAELLGKLPAELRGAFGSPEELIAIATVKKIPLTEAQVAWFNETDDDHAVIGLMLTSADAEAAPALEGVEEGKPPMLPERGINKLAYLSLHRTASGWRLVVPATAVDRIARELIGPKE
jgi:hypothetical protein